MNKTQMEAAHQEILNILNSHTESWDKQARIQRNILELLTTRLSYFEEVRKGSDVSSLQERYKPQSDWYRKQQSIWENLPQGTGNPGWIQVNCHRSREKRSEVNIKIYRTIPTEGYSFIQHLGGLTLALERLGETTHDSISFKFPRGLIGFLKHPDSLVLHFGKKENIDAINLILDTWMKNNSITRGEREGGRTELAADHDNMSFSELIALNFAYQILQNPMNSQEFLQKAVNKAQEPNFEFTNS